MKNYANKCIYTKFEIKIYKKCCNTGESVMDKELEKTKIYNWQINERVNTIVEKLRINKFSTEEKEIWYNLIQKVLLNEQTKLNKNNLLDVIEEVNYYKDAEIIDYINATIEKVLENYSQDKYIILKDKVSSSNHSMVSNLTKYGYIQENNVIKYSPEKELELKEIEENSIILIIDDYVGSGKTIIDILKEIEKKYKKQIVKIISYVWQEKAKERVNEYINETTRNNTYEIYDEDSVMEKSYIEKYEKESTTLKYIEDTCNTCMDKRYKYGYDNTGAMVAINGLAPNNNISMLWRNDLGKGKTWIPPFNRDINTLALQKKREKIIKEAYSNMRNYYDNFCYKSIFSFCEFKMLLLIFNSYCIKINQLTDLLGLDTNDDTEQIIAKFKQYDIIKYEVDNILEFVDKKVIKQFKKINQQLSREALDGFNKECTKKLKL